MKNFKKYFVALSLATLATGCVDKEMDEYSLNQDEWDALGYSPEIEAQFEYVNKYESLKSYLGNKASNTPGNGFLLGIAVNGEVYEKGGDEYLMAAQNFQMVTFGNEMKYGSIVKDKYGNYDFDMVGKLVAKAEKTGHVIIGHTLCWHEQSNPDYLNSLLKDKPQPKPEGEPEGEKVAKEVEDLKMNFATKPTLSKWGDGPVSTTWNEDGTVTFTNEKEQGDDYSIQQFIASSIPVEPGMTYKVDLTAKASEATSIRMTFVNASGNGKQVELTNEYQDFSFEFTYPDEITDWQGNPVASPTGAPVMNLGKFVGSVDVKAVKVTHTEMVTVTDKEVEDVKMNFATKPTLSKWGDGPVTTTWNEDGTVTFTNDTEQKDDYAVQQFITSSFPVEPSMKFDVVVKAKASEETSIRLTMLNASDKTMALSTDYQDFEFTFTYPDEITDWQGNPVANPTGSLIMQLGKFVGSVTVESVKVSHKEAVSGGGTIMEKQLCASYDFEDGKNFSGNGADNYQIKEGEGSEGSNCFFILGSNLNETDGWKVQMQMPYDFEKDIKYFVSMKVKGSAAGSFYMTHEGVDSPNWNAATFDFTTEWTEVKKSYTPSTDGGQFNINIGKAGADLWIDDFEIYCEKEVQVGGIPLTAEEKRDTLLWELNRYMEAMFEATDNQVYVWDLLNEPMNWFGRFQSESDYDEEAQKNKFFWHTYLGDSFGADLAKIAREKYKGEKDLLLFINDYNLEASNAKLEGLIKAINDWDAILKAEGVKEIDGIASQCHISYQENPEELDKLKKGYTNALTKLSATGKLVRISEFDMGYIDANGNKLQTGDLTLDQHKNMAEFTQWCMEEYFKVVPANQQFGFTFWCPKDAPEASGWRKGEPVGIWTETGKRKPIYEGIVNALQNN